MNDREMYAELNALLGAIGKALDLTSEQTVKAVEADEIAMEMKVDERGERFITVSFQGRSAQIYQGAIRYTPEADEDEDEDEDDEAGCGHGGCGCGSGRGR